MKQVRKIIIYLIIISTAVIVPIAVYAVKLPDPLQAENIFELVGRVIQAILGIVGTLALLNFAIAGIGIIMSRGNPEKVQKHKDNLIWTTIGIVILFGSYALISYVLSALTGVTQ